MTFTHRTSILLLFIALVALTVSGCGGGGRSSSTDGYGSASITILWPGRADSTPDAQSVKLTILDSGSAISERTVNRPSDGAASTVSFDPLPTGTYTARVRAYPQPNAGGTASGEGNSPIAVQTALDTKLSYAASGTVDHVEVTSADPSVPLNNTTILTATPMTADGVVVIVPIGSIAWQSANTGVAQVDANGMVTGVSAGETDITATETASGRNGSLTVTITGSRWTVMVYMAADNNLEPYAIQDMNELESVGSTGDVTVVTQIDRASSFDTTNGNWTGARRYYVTRDPDTEIMHSQQIADLGDVNMASPQTLTSFVQWATSAYPADHYLLVMWDHGRGWRTRTDALQRVQREVKAICIDESSHDEMSLGELTQGLGSAHRTDVVLFDACLMGMIEVAYAIKDSADIMVASEENVPVQGQAYGHLLDRLTSDPHMTTNALSTAIIEEYIGYYASGYMGTFSMSAVDLHSIARLTTSTDRLAGAILANLGAVRSGVQFAQANTQHYDFDKNEYRYYRDLYDFARLVNVGVTNTSVRSAAQEVMAAVQSTVLSEGHIGREMEMSHGISIYLPTTGTALSQYSDIEFAQASRWDDLVNQY